MAHQKEPIAIPPEIVTFLDGACVAFAGTRNRDLIPAVHRVTGWRVGTDRQTMTCMIPGQFLRNLISSLEENGEFAVTVSGSTTGVHRSNPPRPATDAHETYQFKGKYLESRPVSDEDLQVHHLVRSRFVKLYTSLLGVPEDLVAKFVLKPELAVTFRVNEIYTQTPGPNAGRRLVPPPEEAP